MLHQVKKVPPRFYFFREFLSWMSVEFCQMLIWHSFFKIFVRYFSHVCHLDVGIYWLPFFHWVWAFPGSWFDEWFSVEMWTFLYCLIRLWILNLLLLLASTDTHSAGEEGELPCYCQVDVWVQVLQSPWYPRWKFLVIPGWGDSSISACSLHWDSTAWWPYYCWVTVTVLTLY